MTRRTLAAIAAAALAGVATGADAQVGRPGVTGYVTLASDYRSRGLSQANADGALHLGVDYRHDSGWFAGAWGARVEYGVEAGRDEPRRAELGLYGGYGFSRGPFRVAGTLSRYAYPGASIDYDYEELAASFAYRDRLFLSVAYTDDFYGTGRRALTEELGFAWPLAWNTELGATVGRLEYDPVPGGSYTYWNVGASKLGRRFAYDLRFHAAGYDGRSYFGSDASERWVLSVTYGFRPGS